MKFIHLSDLHIGKRVNEFSMLNDQKYILGEILKITSDEKPDAVLIAGDVYDKSIPSAEAVIEFDEFLERLSKTAPAICIISGNHDSPERLSFGARLLSLNGVHISRIYNGNVDPIMFTDGWGSVAVYMLPFIKPAHVRKCFPESEINSYNEAVRYAVSKMNVNPAVRNVLVTHQFVTGGERCESEELSVGGSDNVDASVFEVFDYTALGHLHGPQSMNNGRIRYSGSPLKYSFSEVKHEKSVSVVEMKGKGDINLRTVPLKPVRDMSELRGTYNELMSRPFYQKLNLKNYYHITLTDESDIPDAVNRLRTIYVNLMRLDYDNTRTRNGGALPDIDAVGHGSPLELFSDFYEKQNGRPMSEEQRGYMAIQIERIWEGER